MQPLPLVQPNLSLILSSTRVVSPGAVWVLRVKRFTWRHYENHTQFRQHLDHFIAAYNFGRRLKTLKGLTPYEFICKQWTKEPERFRFNPLHQMPGLNI